MFIFFLIFIQIIAEVLPISSSGHIFLLKKAWNFAGYTIDPHQIFPTIDFLLHIPTLFVLLLFFFKRWWNIILHKPIHYLVFFEKESWKKIGSVLIFLGVSSFITFLFWWKRYYEYVTTPVWIGFLATGLVLFAMKFLPKVKTSKINQGRKGLWQIQNAVILGLVQGAMMNAGFSRFGFTLFFSRLLGYNFNTAFEISFLLEMPLLFGASMKALLDIYKKPEIFSEYFAIHGLFAMLVAAILSYFVLKGVNKLVEKNKLHYISGYMIIPLIISLLFERGS